MFGWLRKKWKRADVIYFKSNDAAFAYASQFMQGPLLKDSILFGQVIQKVESDLGKLLKFSQDSGAFASLLSME
jgi:hypothetical protein